MKTNKPFSLEKMGREYLESALTKLQKETKFRLTITIPQVANLLGINNTSAYQLAKRKDFPKIVIGKRIIVPIVPFLHWVEQQSSINV